jgi:hypothetical protein
MIADVRRSRDLIVVGSALVAAALRIAGELFEAPAGHWAALIVGVVAVCVHGGVGLVGV